MSLLPSAASRRREARPAGRYAVRSAATSAVVLAALLSGCGSSAEDEPTEASGYDEDAAAASAHWLAGQLTDGLIHNDEYGMDDHGLSADTALALEEVEGHDAEVAKVADRLAEEVEAYVAPGFGTVESAGALAKLVLLAEAADVDPASFGGEDLVARLEGRVAADGPIAGRLQDRIDPKQKDAADWSNVFVQAYGVLALAEAGSDRVDAATGFLLDQQCADGWLRVSFAPATAGDQTCDGDPASAPDVDATALAALALLEVDDDEAVAAADRAVAWLAGQQGEDGSFSTADPAVANANSTGLAGRALAQGGETAGAERAAAWVAAHQLGTGEACGEAADAGAIAYDDTARAAAVEQGITTKTAYQFRLATVQALPLLSWLPEDAAASDGSC